MSKEQAHSDTNNDFIRHCDYGGLLYPSSGLSGLVSALEESCTVFFSSKKMNAESMQEFAMFLQSVDLPEPGCDAHHKELTLSIVKFYVLLRFRFYAKSLNKEQSSKREQAKHLKLRRCNWAVFLTGAVENGSFLGFYMRNHSIIRLISWRLFVKIFLFNWKEQLVWKKYCIRNKVQIYVCDTCILCCVLLVTKEKIASRYIRLKLPDRLVCKAI